jgi:hypothetical protein
MPSIAATAYSHKAHNLLCQDTLIAKKRPKTRQVWCGGVIFLGALDFFCQLG